MAEKAAIKRSAKRPGGRGDAVPAGRQLVPAPAKDEIPFWRRKKLESLSAEEWESLCDGCGRCCLVKLEDADAGRIHFTDVACQLLEAGSCRCGDYAHRQKHVPDCIKLTPADVHKLPWLPPTCAYRLVGEGKDLMWWHPLVSGSPETVHEAGVSVRDKVSAYEDAVDWDDLPDYVVRWPGQIPKQALGAGPADKPASKAGAAAKQTGPALPKRGRG